MSGTATNKHYDTLHSMNVVPDYATPMVRQFLNVKKDYPGVILFYRMGDFYETFLEDALITARVLEITLTGRDAGKCGRIPMAGIPVKAAETYLNKLLSQNVKVAICEQMEDPSQAKGLVERKVVRVLSPGTITEQSLLKPEENNFLAALTIGKKPDLPCGLAYCDISTGTLNTCELTYPQLLSELNRIQPVEILVEGTTVKSPQGRAFDEIKPNAPTEITSQYACTAVNDMASNWQHTQQKLRTLLQVDNLNGFELASETTSAKESTVEKTCGMLASYLSQQFIDDLPVIDGIHRYHLDDAVHLNATARRNLELLATAKNGQYEGSLLSVLNQTCTSMGVRLLRQWISRPLTNLAEINSRLDSIEELTQESRIRQSLRDILPDVYDIERLGTKIANQSVQPRDLIALKHSMARLPEMASLLKTTEGFYLERMQSFPPELFKMVALIEQAIDDSPAMTLKEGGILKHGFHHELDKLRSILATHEDWLKNYEEQERDRTGVKTLKVSFNNAFGYFIEMTRANSHLAPDDYHRKQTLTNAERYTTDILKQQESQVLDAQGRLYDLEYHLFIELRQQLLPYASLLKDCAHRVAALDVIQSLATVAVEQHYSRPTVEDSLELIIEGGRHPVIEKMLPLGKFVANPCQLSSNEREFNVPQIQIITGPNMAGKSTYMRQVALITLMAQMGSFVPASYARVGMIDGLYTRVGAVDDLASGQSTFMVEMNETAQILHGATRKSLVLLDEVGRGTSTYDGVSIAWAVTEYIANKLGCRTLFATHYHELNVLESTNPKIQNMRVCVSETDGDIEFLHTVTVGSAQKSYGIQVAKMAGIPSDVTNKASAILNHLQKQELANVRTKDEANTTPTPQLSLF